MRPSILPLLQTNNNNDHLFWLVKEQKEISGSRHEDIQGRPVGGAPGNCARPWADIKRHPEPYLARTVMEKPKCPQSEKVN